jgi:hypothetical protein
MITQKQLNVLQQATKEAFAKEAQRKLDIVGKTPGPHTLFFPKGANPDGPFWAGLTWHADDPDLLFCVPADDCGGPCDVTDISTQESSFPVILRCGQGSWVHRDELPTEIAGIIAVQVCEQAIDLVARLVK